MDHHRAMDRTRGTAERNPQDGLPGWTGNIHIIKAVTKPSVAESQATALLASHPFAGDSRFTDGFTDENTPGPGRITDYLTVTGAAAYETAISRLREPASSSRAFPAWFRSMLQQMSRPTELIGREGLGFMCHYPFVDRSNDLR
jgi:hypothetical protein